MSRTKPNFVQIAELAGVSASTVDRVLNDRGGVSEARRRRVVEAARTLGTGRVLPSAVRGSIHFDVIRTQEDTEFYRRLDEAMFQLSRRMGATISLHRSIWTGEDLALLPRFISKSRHRRHGLILISQELPQLHEALRQAINKGIPAVSMVSALHDVPGAAYVGIDNHAAGATAGRFMGRFIRGRGRVLLLSGSQDYLAHRERCRGFLEVMQRDFPELEVVGPVDIDDRPALAESAVRQRLAGDAPLVGLYNTGAASGGIERALEVLPRPHWPVWIAHECHEDHARLVREGRIWLVLDQDAEAQAQAALQHLLSAHGEAPAPDTLGSRFHVVTDANWPLS